MAITDNSKKRVLFLCTGNSARSQMAQVILQAKAGERYQAFSAGTQPEEVDKRTLATLNQFGLATDNLHAKHINELGELNFDYVITLCDQAMQECRTIETSAEQLAWDFHDPKTRSGIEPFATTFLELSTRIGMFLLVDEQLSLRQLSPQNSASISPTEFFKCLTDDIRLSTLLLTNYFGEICVCELMEAIDEESQPKVSRNLAVLKKAGLLSARKHGQWVFYRINPVLPAWAKNVIAQTLEHNVELILPSLARLTQMSNRPDKVSRCAL